jgi:hypothetical protein
MICRSPTYSAAIVSTKQGLDCGPSVGRFNRLVA